MRNGCVLLGLVAFCCTSLLACTSGTGTLDSETLPYKLEEVVTFRGSVFHIDLNGDGRDERVLFSDPDPLEGRDKLILMTQEGKTIEQVNYAEKLRSLHFLDLERDDIPEILASFVRNDSLFASLVSAMGHKLYQIYLTEGEPRMEEDGSIPWDPHIREAFATDVNADGKNELVTVIATSYARLPRGVLVHSLSDRQLMGEAIIGAIPESGNIFLGDYDDDERPEVAFATGASMNDAVAGGMDDHNSYLVAFDLDRLPEVKWVEEMGGEWTFMRLLVGDLDGDAKDEFLAYKQTLRARPTPTQLLLVDPATGKTYKEHLLDEPIRQVGLVNLDRDARTEILALGVSGELKLLNGELKLLERRQMVVEPVDEITRVISILPDADGDGVDEIIVQTRSGSVLLDPQLRVKAVLPGSHAAWGIVQQGIGTLPFLYAQHATGTSVYRLVENRFYHLKRYGPSLVWIVLVGLVGLWLAGGFLVVSNYRKNRQLDKTIQNNVRKYTGQAEDDFIDRAYEVVSNHYSDSHFNVEAFADEMECSPRTLQRDLKARIGCSPSKFIWTFRFERAKKLLEDSELTIKEIAHKVGFESPEHFSTMFRKAKGVSPSRYRKNVASSNPSKSS